MDGILFFLISILGLILLVVVAFAVILAIGRKKQGQGLVKSVASNISESYQPPPPPPVVVPAGTTIDPTSLTQPVTQLVEDKTTELTQKIDEINQKVDDKFNEVNQKIDNG